MPFEKPLRQVNAFRELESSLEQTGKSMRDARDRVRDLSGELARSDVPTRKLQESYRASVRELQRLAGQRVWEGSGQWPC